MKTTFISILLVTTLFCYGQNELPKPFADLVEKAGLTFTFPQNFKAAPVIKNPVIDYDYAMKYENTDEGHTCELRFIVRPAGAESHTDKEEFSRIFVSTMSSIFTTPFILTDEFSVGNGDLTNAADMVTSYEHYLGDGYTFKKEFAQEYSVGLIIAMQKTGYGEVYIFLLGTNNECMDYTNDAFYTLKFKK